MKRAAELKPGSVVADRWRVGARYRQGQHEVVFRARDLQTGRETGLRTLPFAPPPDFLGPFQRAVLRCPGGLHPGWLGVLAWGPDAGHGAPYAITDLVEGPTLAEVLEAKGRVPPGQALDVTRQLLELVGAVRAAGIEPGLTPAVVRLDLSGGRVFLEAFRLDAVGYGGFTGYPQEAFNLYVAPESLLAGRQDERGDVYVVGALLYRMLSGRSPVAATTVLEWMQYTKSGVGARPLGELRPDLPPALTGAIDRALATEPEARWPDAAAFAAALR